LTLAGCQVSTGPSRATQGRVAVAGPCRFVGGPFWAVVYPKLLFGLVHLLHLVTGRVCYVSAANLAFRRDAWTGYDTRLTQGGDELDLLRRLRARGRLVFDLHNPTRTSARRLNRGLIYNIAVTFLFYYVLGYCLNRLFHRRLVGTAPAVRGTAGSSASRRWRSKSISSMLSAPATIPATSDVTVTSAFAPPSPLTVTLVATRSGRPHRVASAITGAIPAHDTRFGSSNLAEKL
jgi:hypothetical protein